VRSHSLLRGMDQRGVEGTWLWPGSVPGGQGLRGMREDAKVSEPAAAWNETRP